MCEREREGERSCVCVSERERGRERQRKLVCVCLCVCVCVCVRERERERERACVCVREREREMHAVRGHRASSMVWETWSHLAQAVPLSRRTLRNRAAVGVDAHDIGGRDLERHALGQRDVHCLDGETHFGVHGGRICA